MRRPALILVLALALVPVLAACGSGDEEEAAPPAPAPAEALAGGGATLQIAADPGGAYAFDQTSLEAPAGSVTIEFTNDSSVEHNVTIEGLEGAATETIAQGSSSLTLDLQAGAYTFYCSEDGHRAAGMEGTLAVGGAAAGAGAESGSGATEGGGGYGGYGSGD